jgi:hypothetical protein
MSPLAKHAGGCCRSETGGGLASWLQVSRLCVRLGLKGSSQLSKRPVASVQCEKKRISVTWQKGAEFVVDVVDGDLNVPGEPMISRFS